MSNIIDQTMGEAINNGVFPSAELVVAKNGQTLINGAYGNAITETIFDIASLTKPIATTTLAMQLVAEDRIRLNDEVKQHLPHCSFKMPITIRHLLSHSSGLPAWQPYYQIIPTDSIGTSEGKFQIIDAICREQITFEPGNQSTYSDIGFILLGEIIETATGKKLNELFFEKIAKPLDLKNTFFIPLNQGTNALTHQRTLFAPTEDCPWRKKIIQGEVHDQNCYAMGGVAGHAGLFSTATDINKFILDIVACYRGSGTLVPQEIIKRFLPFHYNLTICNSTWLLGWDRPSYKSSQAGVYFSNESIGHLGYTGCSMWIDLKEDFWVILLTNRIHPTTTNEKIKSFRPMLHNLIYEELIKQ